MWRLLVCVLMASVLQARDLRTRQTICPNVCDLSRCSSALESCYFGVVKDRCDCCAVCAAGEGEYCGGREHGLCGQGMTCEYRTSARGTCVCDSHEPVCGSDGRTYPSICRLKAENRRAEMSGIPAVIFIQRGPCETGEEKTVCFGVHNTSHQLIWLHLDRSVSQSKRCSCFFPCSVRNNYSLFKV